MTTEATPLTADQVLYLRALVKETRGLIEQVERNGALNRGQAALLSAWSHAWDMMDEADTVIVSLEGN